MIDNHLPFHRALLWIFVSTLLVSGSAFMGWLYFQHVKEKKFHDDQYRIVAIIQNSLQGESLRTAYLAELLNLSYDRPINLYQFNIHAAEETLLAHPLIKQVMIKKILPGSLYIQYQMRIPVAMIGDYSNTAVDEEGFLFPYRPFFTPKRLPIIYLGIEKEEYHWGCCLKDSFVLKLAFKLMEQFKLLKQDQFFLKQVDVAQALADSYGQRQMILLLEQSRQNQENSPFKNISLRLSSDHYQQDLSNFSSLIFHHLKNDQNLVNAKEFIVDLRIPHLAFVKSRD